MKQNGSSGGKMRHTLAFVLGVFSMATFAFSSVTSKRPSAACTVPNDEMQVLVSFLNPAGANRRDATVLVTKTDTSDVDIDYANLRLATSGRGVPAEVRDDLKNKNRTTCDIPAYKWRYESALVESG
jgi:hypothetical protein